jgi:hypothetical protein
MAEPTPETFAAGFGRALERRHASMSWLRDRLAARGYPISLATLSYWRTGQRVPTRTESLDALAFGTEHGDLLGERDVERVLFHLTVDIDRAQQRAVSSVTQLFVAMRDGVSGVSMFVGPDSDGESNSSHVEAVSGCRIGPSDVRADGIRSVRLEFERPCRAGESVLVQAEVVDQGPYVEHETEWGLVAEQRLEEAMLVVRFQPHEAPERCWIGYQENGVEDEWEVELAGRTSVHHRLTAFGPGTCLVRWEW